MREKIEDGFVFKQHVDKALALRPDDPSLHHLLGRFKYEVSILYLSCIVKQDSLKGRTKREPG
jgi:hypothetical protein